MAAFTEIKRAATQYHQWHCPHCGRLNYEPSDKYEDGCNLLDTLFNSKGDNVITFSFECPHCQRQYEEDYQAAYISTLGEQGRWDNKHCQHCGDDEESENILTDGWWYFVTDKVISIERSCGKCGEEHQDWYRLEYISHYELEEIEQEN